VAYTAAGPDRLSDVAIVPLKGGHAAATHRPVGRSARPLELGRLEEFRVPSSFDGKPIQAWAITPPGFDPARKYPLVLEIHGGDLSRP